MSVIPYGVSFVPLRRIVTKWCVSECMLVETYEERESRNHPWTFKKTVVSPEWEPSSIRYKR